MIDFNIKIFSKLSGRPGMDIPMKFTIFDSITAFGFNLKTFLFRKSKSHSIIRGIYQLNALGSRRVHVLQSLGLTSKPLCIITLASFKESRQNQYTT